MQKKCVLNLENMPQKRMECMNRASVFEWHKRFKEGREPVRDDERCGRSKEVRTPELIGQIKNFIDNNRRVSMETICLVSGGAQRRPERKTLSWQQGDGRADQFRSRSS